MLHCKGLDLDRRQSVHIPTLRGHKFSSSFRTLFSLPASFGLRATWRCALLVIGRQRTKLSMSCRTIGIRS